MSDAIWNVQDQQGLLSKTYKESLRINKSATPTETKADAINRQCTKRKFEKATNSGTDASKEHKVLISNHLIHKIREVDKTQWGKGRGGGTQVPWGTAAGSVDTTTSPLKQIHSMTQHFHLWTQILKKSSQRPNGKAAQHRAAALLVTPKRAAACHQGWSDEHGGTSPGAQLSRSQPVFLWGAWQKLF